MARLGDVGLVITGNTPKTSESQNYESNDICFVKPSDITDGTVTHLEDSEFYISECARAKARILPPESVLVTCIGIIGKVAINDMECAFNQQINAIIPDKSICLTEYLAYAIQNKQAEMQDIANAPVVPILNKTQFSDIEIKLPSLSEQHVIVKKLSAVSNLIALRKKLLEKLDQLVKSRFIELFGDPEDSTMKWERTSFASVCLDMHQGINTVADKVEYVSSGFPIIQSKNITSGFLDLEDVRYVRVSDYEYYRKKYNPKPSDLLVCNIGTIGKSLIVENEVDFLIAWNLFLIKLNKEVVNPIFIKVFIELLNQQNYFEKYMTGGTVKFVNKKTMGNISTPLPPLELQEQFAAFVEQTDKSKLAIQQSLDKLETLKKSLMQEYFG